MDGINCGRLTNVKARQAMCYAFPYEDVRDGVYEGLVVESAARARPILRGYDPNGFIYTPTREGDGAAGGVWFRHE